jgi:tetratricopeptide (TPR) repeat protein
MNGLVLAMTLAALPSQKAANAALADYMSALAVAKTRWARMAQLTVDGKVGEAKALGERLPPVLAQDFGESDTSRFRDVPYRPDALAWARWSYTRGQPALEAWLYRQAGDAGLALTQDQRKQWFHACAEMGDVECLARLGPEQTLTPDDRGKLEALTARTLAPPEALQARRALARPFSLTLALERWALAPRTAEDRVQRLMFVRDILWKDGRRLANEALIADPALPMPDFVNTAIDLVNYSRSADEAVAYWNLVASNPRAPEHERARARHHMGLTRQRQGLPDAAESEFRKALAFEGPEATAALLQIGHVHFQRSEYKKALAAYRKAEARHWDSYSRRTIACANDDPRSNVVPYVLYQGIALERLGRVREAMAEYASVLLDAPRGWRRPLALHMIETYDAAGRLDVLERLLDGVEKANPAAFDPMGISPQDKADGVKTILAAYRLEKQRDWRTLAAHLAAADREPMSFGSGRGHNGTPLAAAHALARHCDEALPLLPPAASNPQAEMRPWAKYTRELCAGDRFVLKPGTPERGRDAELPEVEFPRVAAADLPDPIVCASRGPHAADGSVRTWPCP